VRILVTISRDYPLPELAVRRLMEAIYDPAMLIEVKGPDGLAGKVTVVHGASHMDWLLAGVALALGQDHEPHPYIGRLGKAGGPVRNQEMVDAGADLCLAFIARDSRGARDCFSRARNAGIRTTGWNHEGRQV